MRPYLIALPDWLPGPLSAHPLFSYGLMLGLGIFLAWGLAAGACRIVGYDARRTSGALFWCVAGGLLGARLFWFASDPAAKLSLLKFLDFTSGGLVAYGGYIGGILGGWAYLRIQKHDFWSFADCTAPSLAIGLGFARLGCFLYGCDYGLPVSKSTPAALRFPRWDLAAPSFANKNPPALDTHMRTHGLAADAAHSLPVIPVQLLESLVGFAIFAVLLVLRRRKSFDGQTLLQFLLIYGTWRFLIEFARGDVDRGVGVMGTPFSTSQVIALLLFAGVAQLWAFLRRRGTVFAVLHPAFAAAGPAAAGRAPRTPPKRNSRKRSGRKGRR